MFCFSWFISNHKWYYWTICPRRTLHTWPWWINWPLCGKLLEFKAGLATLHSSRSYCESPSFFCSEWISMPQHKSALYPAITIAHCMQLQLRQQHWHLPHWFCNEIWKTTFLSWTYYVKYSNRRCLEYRSRVICCIYVCFYISERSHCPDRVVESMMRRGWTNSYQEQLAQRGEMCPCGA